MPLPFTKLVVRLNMTITRICTVFEDWPFYWKILSYNIKGSLDPAFIFIAHFSVFMHKLPSMDQIISVLSPL